MSVIRKLQQQLTQKERTAVEITQDYLDRQIGRASCRERV